MRLPLCAKLRRGRLRAAFPPATAANKAAFQYAAEHAAAAPESADRRGFSPSDRGVCTQLTSSRASPIRRSCPIGKPKAVLRLPFGFNLFYGGNAFDFSCDLSEIVYGRSTGQADVYLLPSE